MWPWIRARLFGNYGMVIRGSVYRSGQSWIGYLLWPLLGLETVINLSHKPEKDLHDRFEEWLCRKLDIFYVHMPTLEPGKFDEVLVELIHSRKPVLVHCEAGKDRTGALIAAYEKEWLGRPYYDICHAWETHRTPSAAWLTFLFDRWCMREGQDDGQKSVD